MIPIDRLFLVCKDVLTAVEVGYAVENVALPDRRYVANGDQQVAFDCEQLSVAHQITNSYGGNAAFQEVGAKYRDPAHSMRLATIALTLVRCAPGMDDQAFPPTFPTPAEEEVSAMDIYQDGQLMLNSLLTAQKTGAIGRCGSVVFLDVTTPGTQGLFASTKLRVQLGLE